jgi:hypothetical protein
MLIWGLVSLIGWAFDNDFGARLHGKSASDSHYDIS